MYKIGVAHHDTLRDAIVDAFSRPFHRGSGARNQDNEDTIWALKDVSFEVQHGEVVGIIGRNGAGKSTLLKILSRITEPTSGRAVINGRVGSLLEVGTGFHPELTGRENIYLNGAILGMTRREIDRKFDEIVAFAEIEKFLDTPVKRYSSGMYVRLAFAVAAHLEPEILLVDEVLAVGDAAFQKKCLGKMGEVAKEGRTVLFVSHNMSAVLKMCKNTILLHGGKLVSSGASDSVVRDYISKNVQKGEAHFDSSTPRTGSGEARFTRVKILDKAGSVTNSILMGNGFSVELEFVVHHEIKYPVFSIRLHTPLGNDIVAWRTNELMENLPALNKGGKVILDVKHLNLLPGEYDLAIAINNGYQTVDWIENAIRFEVVTDGNEAKLHTHGEVIYLPGNWFYEYK